MSKYAIDFDGVIIERDEAVRGKDWFGNPPKKYAKETIKHLMDKGHELYICTARTSEEWPTIEDWLYKYDFPELRIKNEKEEGTDVYVDDRAVRFTNWLDMGKLLA